MRVATKEEIIEIKQLVDICVAIPNVQIPNWICFIYTYKPDICDLGNPGFILRDLRVFINLHYQSLYL